MPTFQSTLPNRFRVRTDRFGWAGCIQTAAVTGLASVGWLGIAFAQQQINPFVVASQPPPSSAAWTDDAVSPAREFPTPSWNATDDFGPVATARLQIPQPPPPSTPAMSVFVGPQWDTRPVALMQPDPWNSTNDRQTKLPRADDTKLANASRRRAEYLRELPPEPKSGASLYLASQTSQSESEIAVRLFQQAQLEYDCAAYASAETSAWQSLAKSAQAMDLANAARYSSPNDSLANQQLHRGYRAIVEACGFVASYAQNDPIAIARLARSHETPVVRESLPPINASHAGYPASEAIDRYLDYARTQFVELSAGSLLAAQTLDLLAAIRLGRNQLDQLPGPTAVCLRRAAVQGQSNNPDLAAKLGYHLADIGLVDEARWALSHCLTLQPNSPNAPLIAARLASLQRNTGRQNITDNGQSIVAVTNSRHVAHSNREPDVITMSPEQFASISTSVLPSQSNGPSQNDRPDQAAFATTQPQDQNGNSPSFFKSVAATFRRTLPGQDGSAFQTVSNSTPGQSYSGPTVMDAAPIYPSTPTSDPGSDVRPRTSSRDLPATKRWW